MQLLQFAISLQLLIFIQPSQSKESLAFIYDLEDIYNTVHSDISEISWLLSLPFYVEKEISDKQIKVLQHFNNISLLVDQIEQRYADISTKINNSVVDHRLDADKPNTYEIESWVFELKRISEDFPKMESLESYEISTLKEFTDARPEDSELGKRLNKAFYSTQQEFAQNYMGNWKNSKYWISPENLCHLQLFPQQYLYALFMDVALTELKALILIEYSLMMRRVSGEGYLTAEREKMRVNYWIIVLNNHIILKNTMLRIDPRLWRCDPPKQIHGVTYDMMTRLLQGYVDNVVDLNTDESSNQTCPDFRNVSNPDCVQQPKCSGHLHDCLLIGADMSDISVCQSPANSTRRYCFCLCDQEENSDRYFNLRETKSDIADNKVVTGVRFVKKNRVFHLQIQQGQLMPRGVINESTLEWKPVDDYKITDPNVTAGVDYHKLCYGNRTLHLDQIAYFRHSKYIVTGVGFYVLDKSLNLKVHFNKFDFEKGELVEVESKCIWRLSSLTRHREKVNLDNLDVPTLSAASSQPIMQFSDHYLDFGNTGIYKDAAQTTIPFIDTQDVVSLYPMPLSSIGLFYKGSPGYGGYIAPKIINYEFTNYIPTEFEPLMFL